jgi:pimeloyl-ACP methyl ester carboxylesterase
LTLSEHFATVGDIRLHYVADGDGTPVIFLHGFPETSYSWRKQLPALAAAGFRAVAVDLRGYGKSSRPREVDAYRVTELVRDIAGLAIQLGARQFVGHDWGGVIGWFLPMLHPDVVDRLVILNSPHPVPLTRELRGMRQKLRFFYHVLMRIPRLPEMLLPVILPMMMRRAGRFTEEDIATMKEAWRDRDAPHAMANYYRAVHRYRPELRAAIRRIDNPTMLIWGERDPVFVPQVIERFGEWVPDLRLERIPNAGHFVQTDAAERVNELLLSFLKR